MTYSAQHSDRSGLDALADRLRDLSAQEPISMGVAAGILAGGIAGSGAVFFIVTAIVWVFSLRLQRDRIVRST
jgi:hypothetical protein